jgi:hypothetical protein
MITGKTEAKKNIGQRENCENPEEKIIKRKDNGKTEAKNSHIKKSQNKSNKDARGVKPGKKV